MSRSLRLRRSSAEARPSVGPVNFGRDLTPLARRTALAVLSVSVLAAFMAAALIAEAQRARSALPELNAYADALETRIETVRREAEDAPDLATFRALRDRVERINALDYAAAPATGALLNTLEGLTPDDARFVSLDYDRQTVRAELVAVSAESDALTRLFQVMNEATLFSAVRLLDKKQIAQGGKTVTQVHFEVDLAGQDGAAQ